MNNHEIIIYNFIIFFSIFCIAYLLSNIFPGRILASSTTKKDVSLLETRRTFRSLIQSIYIVILTLCLSGMDVIFSTISEYFNLFQKIDQFLITEENYLDSWLIFWAVAGILHLIEFRFRSLCKKQNKAFPVSPLLSSIIRGTLLFITGLWIARYVLNWASMHMLVSTTVIMAIVGFSLKGTLGDLLAGISLHISRSVLPSEWIMFSSLNLEGEVISTNWRETRLRTTGGHIHIIPNSFVASSMFHNMSWPDSTRRHSLDFVVGFSNSPDNVEKALLDAAFSVSDVLNIPKPPQVIIKQFLEFGIRYQLRFWSNTFYDRSSIENSVFRAVWQHFNQKDIEFPLLLDTILRKSLIAQRKRV